MYYIYIFAKNFSLSLPRKACFFVAKILALLQYYLSKKDREAVINNLLPIVGDGKRSRECARGVFVNFAYYLVDFFRYPKLDKKFIKKYVKISGLHYLDESISEKKGIIAVTAHLGNYELAAAVTSLSGYKVNAVALAHKDKRVNDFFNKQREIAGVNVIPAGVFTRKCFSLLAAGGMVAFLGDRDFSGGGVKVEMFSKNVLLPRGPAFFSLKTGVNIVPAFFVRKNKEFYHLIFEKPIDTKVFKTEEEVIKEYSAVLEKYIKSYPEQWYLFQNYWLN